MTGTETGDGISAASIVMRALWRDKWLLLACVLIGSVFGFVLTQRPAPPSQSSQTVYLKVTSRFLPREDVFDQFRVEWQRTPLWSGDAKLSASVQYEKNKYVATIRLLTGDASGQAIAQYKHDLQGLIDQFEADVVNDAELQLRELHTLQGQPDAGANDYIASTTHHMRLAIADATGDPGLMTLAVGAPVAHTQGGYRIMPTFAAATILGAIMGVLLSIARMIWSIAGQYARDGQAEAASSPEPARPRR